MKNDIFAGVVTFCRVNSAFSSSEVALPIAAEEGFTGLLSKSGDAVTRGTPHRISLEGLEEITEEDLLKVDSEGRCIITDHGHFGELPCYWWSPSYAIQLVRKQAKNPCNAWAQKKEW